MFNWYIKRLAPLSAAAITITLSNKPVLHPCSSSSTRVALFTESLCVDKQLIPLSGGVYTTGSQPVCAHPHMQFSHVNLELRIPTSHVLTTTACIFDLIKKKACKAHRCTRCWQKPFSVYHHSRKWLEHACVCLPLLGLFVSLKVCSCARQTTASFNPPASLVTAPSYARRRESIT